MLKSYNKKAVEGMRKSGEIACRVLDRVEEYLKKKLPERSITSSSIEELCNSEIRALGGKPECVGYQTTYNPYPYKYASCISPNHVICHGVPNAYILKEGDIVNVDIVVRYGDWLGDTSRTFTIGNVSETNRLLVQAAEEAMYAGMSIVQKGAAFRMVATMIGKYINIFNQKHKTQFSIIPHFCSHGISNTMHEEPSIQHTPNSEKATMIPYHFFTMEPLVAVRPGIKYYEDPDDNWSIVAQPEINSAQFEHTIGLDDQNNLMILTARDKAHENEILSKVAHVRNILSSNKWIDRL